MAKKLKHTIGTDSQFQFTISSVAFDGTITPKDLTGSFVYFELEREGAQVLAKDNDGVGGVTITDAASGVLVAQIEHTELLAELGGDVSYGVLVRDDPTGADDREEAIRGTLELFLELVDVP